MGGERAALHRRFGGGVGAAISSDLGFRPYVRPFALRTRPFLALRLFGLGALGGLCGLGGMWVSRSISRLV